MWEAPKFDKTKNRFIGGGSPFDADFEIASPSPNADNEESTECFLTKCSPTESTLPKSVANEPLPGAYKSAGVIPYTSKGFWLGFSRGDFVKGWGDFGGKFSPDDSDAWDTAKNGAHVEGGLSIPSYTHRIDSKGEKFDDGTRPHVIYCTPVNSDLLYQKKRDVHHSQCLKYVSSHGTHM